MSNFMFRDTEEEIKERVYHKLCKLGKDGVRYRKTLEGKEEQSYKRGESPYVIHVDESCFLSTDDIEGVYSPYTFNPFIPKGFTEEVDEIAKDTETIYDDVKNLYLDRLVSEISKTDTAADNVKKLVEKLYLKDKEDGFKLLNEVIEEVKLIKPEDLRHAFSSHPISVRYAFSSRLISECVEAYIYRLEHGKDCYQWNADDTSIYPRVALKKNERNTDILARFYISTELRYRCELMRRAEAEFNGNGILEYLNPKNYEVLYLGKIYNTLREEEREANLAVKLDDLINLEAYANRINQRLKEDADQNFTILANMSSIS